MIAGFAAKPGDMRSQNSACHKTVYRSEEHPL
jgi:hypothetical protein